MSESAKDQCSSEDSIARRELDRPTGDVTDATLREASPGCDGDGDNSGATASSEVQVADQRVCPTPPEALVCRPLCPVERVDKAVQCELESSSFLDELCARHGFRIE